VIAADYQMFHNFLRHPDSPDVATDMNTELAMQASGTPVLLYGILHCHFTSMTTV
jgi:hypothetical protein